MANQYMVFTINDDIFAVRLIDLVEIIKITDILRLPLTSTFFKGVVNIRNKIIPVIDLSVKFNNNIKIKNDTCIMILQISNKEIGLLIDGVDSIIENDDIKAIPDILENYQNFISGILTLEDKSIMVLNTTNLL